MKLFIEKKQFVDFLFYSAKDKEITAVCVQRTSQGISEQLVYQELHKEIQFLKSN